MEGQLSLQAEIEHFLQDLVAELGEVPETVAPSDNDTESLRHLKTSLHDRVVRYERGWRRIQSLGAVVKDPTRGLLDFYGQVDGRLVWLCWRYGEDRLGYYHDLDAGFAGRRTLSNVRNRLLN